jgi:hypothetical protein
MPLQEKQLGQLRPSNTSAASIYTPASGVTAIIKNITVCNTSVAPAKFSIFHHDSGTTYDQSTALYYTCIIEKNQTVVLPAFMAMNNPTGNLAVQTNTANALTFSVYGAEVTT